MNWERFHSLCTDTVVRLESNSERKRNRGSEETDPYGHVNVVSVWKYLDCSRSNVDMNRVFPRSTSSTSALQSDGRDTYASMSSNVTTEFTQFNRSVATLFALVRFLQGMSEAKQIDRAKIGFFVSSRLTCNAHVELIHHWWWICIRRIYTRMTWRCKPGKIEERSLLGMVWFPDVYSRDSATGRLFWKYWSNRHLEDALTGSDHREWSVTFMRSFSWMGFQMTLKKILFPRTVITRERKEKWRSISRSGWRNYQ